ncbi:MAG TPA: MgtC/SapB family protein [Candidatus Udaeobacter sp.]|jgi:putative Mg2+ transporter-C (MgtC) family protein|nr:MgtC/SapB family protein [Candidatus Udaeobacter sp.]
MGKETLQDIIAMLLSTVLGTLVGWERQMGRKPAGLRTHVLVCMGSTMFTLLTVHSVRAFGGSSLDPTRIVHGVVTGVGFLGAGSILRQEGYVHGLTTAASIWMVAAIGTTVGVHAYPLAVVGTVLALIVLEGYRWVERWLTPGDEDNGG